MKSYKELKNFANYERNRNYGCRIKRYIYNGVEAFDLENELIKVTVLAGKGTDISEFSYKPLDLDFMWHSYNDVKDPAEYVPTVASKGGSFMDFYEGGWQELFPVYGLPSNYAGAEMGAHGEACLYKWDHVIEEDTADLIRVKFLVRTVRSPFLLEKWLSLKTGDATLYIEEKVTNESPVPQRFMWGHHPALGPAFLDDNCEILVDGDCKIAMPMSNKEYPQNAEFEWPFAVNNDGKSVDLSKIRPPVLNSDLEFGITNIKTGKYVVWNNALNAGFGMEWDAGLFPHIWIWEPSGGSEGYPWFGRCYTLGVEPWSHLVSNYEQESDRIKINAGESISTKLKAFATTDRPTK